MRSTRATAAVARLNAMSAGAGYTLVITGAGLFKLRAKIEGADTEVLPALPLDDFVSRVNAMAPEKPPRITKSEAAFMKQLRKKDVAP